MSNDRYETEQPSGMGSNIPTSESPNTGDRPMGFDCCGVRMGEGMATCPCASVMRRHPVVAFVMLAIMGLCMLLIPTGAILGIIAFFSRI